MVVRKHVKKRGLGSPPCDKFTGAPAHNLLVCVFVLTNFVCLLFVVRCLLFVVCCLLFVCLFGCCCCCCCCCCLLVVVIVVVVVVVVVVAVVVVVEYISS